MGAFVEPNTKGPNAVPGGFQPGTPLCELAPVPGAVQVLTPDLVDS